MLLKRFLDSPRGTTPKGEGMFRRAKGGIKHDTQFWTRMSKGVAKALDSGVIRMENTIITHN